MIVSSRPRGFLWLPVGLGLASLVVVPLLWFAVANLHGVPIKTLVTRLAALLGLVLLFTAPFLMEVRTVSRLASGAIRVRWPLGHFEAPVENTWIDVRSNMNRRFVVWVTPSREVKLAWSVSNRGAMVLARKIAAILDVAHHVDPAVGEAAETEAKGLRIALYLFPALVVVTVVIAVVLQFLMMHR